MGSNHYWIIGDDFGYFIAKYRTKRQWNLCWL